ncbi:MAG: translocation/assembly module TamB domain-containing protein [Bacteroidota bacterium]
MEGKIIKKGRRNILKWFLLVLIIMVTAIVVLVNNVRFQRYLGQVASDEATRALGIPVTVERVKLGHYLRIELHNLLALDYRSDTLAKADVLKVRVSEINAFKRVMRFSDVEAEKLRFGLITHESDTAPSLTYLTQRLQDSATSGESWQIQIGALELHDSRFILENRNETRSPEGMDFNYLDVNEIDARLQEFAVKDDTISANIRFLRGVESSGFILSRLESNNMQISSTGWKSEVSRIVTPTTDLAFDMEMDYYDYQAFSMFFDSVSLDVDFQQSTLSATDLNYFSPSLLPEGEKIKMKGLLSGTVADMHATRMDLSFGRNSRFEGDVYVKGLPETAEMEIDAEIMDLYVDYEDIRDFEFEDGKKFSLPQPYDALEYLAVKGNFKGKPDNFISRAEFKTNMGDLVTDIRLKDTLNDVKIYNGKIQATNLNAGKLLNMEKDLGTLDLSMNVNGQGLDKSTLAADVDGYINALQFRQNTFDSINIQGNIAGERFGGEVHINDDLLQFDFTGLADFSTKNADFQFRAELRDAYLTQLRLTNLEDSLSNISATLEADFRGSDIDSISGNVLLSDLVYHQDDFTYRMDSLRVESDQFSSEKYVEIRSDFLDGDIYGDYLLSELGKSFNLSMSQYMPSLYTDSITSGFRQRLDFDLRLKNTRGLSQIFFPQLRVAPGTSIQGNYHGEEADLVAEVHSDSVVFNDIRFLDFRFASGKQDSLYKTTTKVKNVILSESKKEDEDEDEELQLGLERMRLENTFEQDSMRYVLRWDDFDTTDYNKANIRGILDVHNAGHFENRITHSEIIINDSLWRITPENRLTYNDSSLVFSNFIFKHDRQSVGIDGILSDNPEDTFKLLFTDFDVSNFDLMLAPGGVDLDGIANGDLVFSNLSGTPRFTGDLNISGLYFNKQKLGDMQLFSEWDESDNKLHLSSEIVYTGSSGSRDLLNLEGFYYPQGENMADSIDFEGEVRNLAIAVMQPFFDDFLSEMQGYASGKLKITGTSAKPELTGNIGLVRSALRVSFLNTKYYLADEIKLKPDAIAFDSITLYDSLGNTALLNGNIKHNYFKDFALDISIAPQQFAGLNTNRSHNELFYGTAFASGAVNITGPVSDINLSVKARPDENTNIVIPISTSESMAESDFITFIDKTEEKEEKLTFNQTSDAGFNMDFQLDINPNARAEIILPFQMGNIEGRGSGNVRMEINSSGDFNMYGDYFIEEGVFIFKLQNILRNTFTIRRGASISWSGDPYDADVNITAVYKARPSLRGLPAAQGIDPELANERVPVNCIITLKDKLFNPTLDFSIELPNADANVKELVYSSIDTTNNAEMNKQMLYLLVLNSFSVSGLDNSLSSGFGAQSFELLSNQISNWLSQISKDVDVGINYRPGDSYTSEELEVALSTQLFDDRVSIDGNFGMSGMQEQTSANTIVGDVNVEVKITRDGRFRIRAFNRTNNTDLLAVDAPYTQGVGVFYRKEFDTLEELFRKKRARELNQ